MTRLLHIQPRHLGGLLTTVLLFQPGGVSAAASFDVQCLNGCLPLPTQSPFQSPFMLYREREEDPLTLRWMTQTPLSSEDGIVQLYAGNPQQQESIPLMGPLTFEQEGNRSFALQRFEGMSLGQGTFLTIVTLKKGHREEILDWRAWRLMTRAQHTQAQAPVSADTGFELNVTAKALRADSPRGPLPPGRGGDASHWWSLHAVQDQKTNLDLDGDSTGIPGLGVQVAVPWHSAAGSVSHSKAEGVPHPLEAVLSPALAPPPDQELHFESLRWQQESDQRLNLEDEAASVSLQLRHYYTVVTLWTHATVRTFSKQEVMGFFGLFDRTFFAHETSALLKTPSDPRFWASYARREYSADPHLLNLLREQVEARRAIPGLSEVQRQAGDGGPTTYHVALQAAATPWLSSRTTEGAPPEVGVLAVEVVASRTGYGRMLTPGSAGEDGLERAWRKVAGKVGEPHALNLDDPPEGYFTSAVTTQLGTRLGPLPMLQTPLQLTARGLEDPTPEELMLQPKPSTPSTLEGLVKRLKVQEVDPASKQTVFQRMGLSDTVTVPLSATLRAGALVEGKAGGHALNLIPINAYAQYVLKLTLVMLPEKELVSAAEAQLPGEAQHDTTLSMDTKSGVGLPQMMPEVKTSTRIYLFLVTGVVGLIALVVLLYSVPGLRTFLGGFFHFITPKRRDDERSRSKE